MKIILVVDDEVELRGAIVDALELRGYQTIEASNGIEAFELVQSFPVELVVSDIRMPGGDGLELARRILTEGARRPPLIFATGFADVTPEGAAALGAVALLKKPFSFRDLIALVSRVAGEPAAELRESRF